MTPTTMGKLIPEGHSSTGIFIPTMDGCGCSDDPTCQEVGVVVLSVADAAKKIKSVTHNGKVVPLNTYFSLPNGDRIPTPTAVLAADFKDAFSGVINEVESFPLTDSTYDVATRTLTVKHVGQGKVTALTLEDGTVVPLTVTRKCTYSSKCTSRFSVVATVGDLVLNGVTTALPATAWTATPATNTANATALATAINAAATGVTAAGFVATVAANTNTEMYDISFVGTGFFLGKINGMTAVDCGCEGTWVI